MRPIEDSYRHKALRRKLVEGLKTKGISDEAVLEVIGTIPRHFFLDSAFDEKAYEDKAFPISAGQTISQPYTVAYQTQLLNVKRFQLVLEVGTGSGYQAAVLAGLGARVRSIERQKTLYDELKNFTYLNTFRELKRFHGDGFKGLPTYAPFDKVLITAAAPFVPPLLIEQLKVGGQMVLPVNTEENQEMQRLTKNEDGSVQTEVFEKFSFVPMKAGKIWPK